MLIWRQLCVGKEQRLAGHLDGAEWPCKADLLHLEIIYYNQGGGVGVVLHTSNSCADGAYRACISGVRSVCECFNGRTMSASCPHSLSLDQNRHALQMLLTRERVEDKELQCMLSHACFLLEQNREHLNTATTDSQMDIPFL